MGAMGVDKWQLLKEQDILFNLNWKALARACEDLIQRKSDQDVLQAIVQPQILNNKVWINKQNSKTKALGDHIFFWDSDKV